MESLPGAVSIFARAYQKQIGGTKTGQEAITELLDAMKKRKVKGNILTFAGDLASEQAAPNLEAAGRASQAEQARYQNRISDLAVVASNAGVEEGFARIFRTLNSGLSESNYLVTKLAEGFNDVTKWTDDLMLWPQSFVRALEGRDSLVADWLGVDKTKQLIQDWKDVKSIFDQLSKVKVEDIFGDFLPNLQSTTRELTTILNSISEFKRFTETLKKGESPDGLQHRSDTEKASIFGFEYTSPAAVVSDFFHNTGVGLSRAKMRGQAIYDDNGLDNPFYGRDDAFDIDQDVSRRVYSEILKKREDQAALISQGMKDLLLVSPSGDNLATNMGIFSDNNLAGSSAGQQPVFTGADYSKDMAESSKKMAMEAASIQNEYNSVQNNDITLNITVPETNFMGPESEAQLRAMANAIADQLTMSLEHTNVQFPQKE